MRHGQLVVSKRHHSTLGDSETEFGDDHDHTMVTDAVTASAGGHHYPLPHQPHHHHHHHPRGTGGVYQSSPLKPHAGAEWGGAGGAARGGLEGVSPGTPLHPGLGAAAAVGPGGYGYAPAESDVAMGEAGADAGGGGGGGGARLKTEEAAVSAVAPGLGAAIGGDAAPTSTATGTALGAAGLAGGAAGSEASDVTDLHVTDDVGHVATVLLQLKQAIGSWSLVSEGEEDELPPQLRPATSHPRAGSVGRRRGGQRTTPHLSRDGSPAPGSWAGEDEEGEGEDEEEHKVRALRRGCLPKAWGWVSRVRAGHILACRESALCIMQPCGVMRGACLLQG